MIGLLRSVQYGGFHIVVRDDILVREQDCSETAYSPYIDRVAVPDNAAVRHFLLGSAKELSDEYISLLSK